MRVLVSGFGPFGEFTTNPSQLLIESLQPQNFTFQLHTVVLPVVFAEAFARLKTHIDRLSPDYVICTGVAARRKIITPERIAINWMDAPIPDSQGEQPRGVRILDNQPDGLFATVPVSALVEACPGAEISNTAGTYVCNALMFEVLAYGRQNGFKAGFIHVPPTEEMTTEEVLRGMERMLGVLHLDERIFHPIAEND